MTWAGIEPQSPGPLTNTLPTRLMSQFQVMGQFSNSYKLYKLFNEYGLIKLGQLLNSD